MEEIIIIITIQQRVSISFARLWELVIKDIAGFDGEKLKCTRETASMTFTK